MRTPNQLIKHRKVWGCAKEQTYKKHSSEDNPKPFPFSSTHYEGSDHTRCLCGQISSRYNLAAPGIRMSDPEATRYTEHSVAYPPPKTPLHTHNSARPTFLAHVSYARASNCTHG